MLIPHYSGGIGTDGTINEYDQILESDPFFEFNAQVTVEVSQENSRM